MDMYVLTDGSYSDYHIVGVFSSKKKALQLKKEAKLGSDCGVEVFRVDEFDNVPNLSLFSICMNKNGDTQEASKISKDNLYGLSAALTGIPDILRKKKLCMFVFAKDEEHAVKIVNEKRIQLIANGELE